MASLADMADRTALTKFNPVANVSGDGSGRRTMPVKHFAFVVTLLLAGCTNGYEKFYQPNPAPGIGVVALSGDPQLVAGSQDAQGTVFQMYQNGYGLVGAADFSGPAQDRAGAIKQAKKVGASIIVVSQKYQNTVSGSVPLTRPTSTTSFSSGTANISGTGGDASGTYSGTTTTYGTETTYIPYSIDRYEQAALFFAPLPRKGLGVLFGPLTNAQRQQIATNQAVQVVAVRNGSPAFLADVLPGDYLLSIDGQAVYDNASMAAAQQVNIPLRAAGHPAQLVLLRNGQKISKAVLIPVGEW
jgi:hypothetical protein